MPTFKFAMMWIAFACWPTVSWAQSGGELAEKAKKILQSLCYRCHGENGTIEGGVNYLLDRNQLVSRGKVQPKEPAKSRIIKRILLEEMPPDGEKHRPSAAELAILKEWVTAGAVDFNPPTPKRNFIDHASTLTLVRKDLGTLPAFDRRAVRYFSFAHLFNANLSDDELTTYRQGLSKLVNSLSWGKRIVPPVAIDPDKTIFRVDLRDLKWSVNSWATLEAHYPFGLLVSSPDERIIQEETAARLPILRGDWFVASAALPPLYHDLLGLPTTVLALERSLRVTVVENIREGEAMRAGFNSSGVSRNNRLIERHSSLFGAYWRSYDFAGNNQAQNLFASPLGPGLRVTNFKHDGGEIIFNLPNGLQGYMLIDAKGNRLDRGPNDIVSDPRRPDHTVVNGLSCMSCHSRGIISKEDQIRPHVEANRQAFLKDELQQILAIYPPRQRMQAMMEEDAARFRDAVEKTGCRLGATEPIAALTQRFESELDLTHAACELGISPDDLRKRFAKSVTLARLMGPLAIPGGTVQRDVFTENFPAVVQDLGLGRVAARERVGGILWTAPIQPPILTPKFAPPIFPGKPKAPRRFNATPSAFFQDPWYFHLSGHATGQIHAVAISRADKRIAAIEGTTGIVTVYHRGHHSNWATMTGHTGQILALDFSPTGELLASGSSDQTARIWDANTGDLRQTLAGHAGFVRAVRFSPDRKSLATGSERVRIWDVATGAEKAAFAPAATWIESLAYSPDGRIIASAGKSVQLWETVSGKLLKELTEHGGVAHCVAFSPDGKSLAYGTSEGLIHLVDSETYKTRAIPKAHRHPVSALAFNTNGKLLASASRPEVPMESGEFKAWDPATGQELASQTGHKAAITGLALSADGHIAVTAGLDGHMRFRDLTYLNRVPLEPFVGHYHNITGTAFSRDGTLVATCGSDRSVRIWDAKKGNQLHRFDGHAQPGLTLAFASDGKHVYSAGADRDLCKWNLATGKLSERSTLPQPIRDIMLSADGKVMVLDLGAVIRVIDIATGDAVRNIKGPLRNLLLSPDGKHLAGALSNNGMHIWSIATGEKVTAIGPPTATYTAAAFSPDGKRLLTGARDNSVYLWDVQTGNEIVRLKGCTKSVHSVAFGHDGKKILASSGEYKTPVIDGRFEYEGCAVLMWDTAGKILHRWDTHPTVIRRMAVSPTEPIALFVTGTEIRRIELP